MQKMGWFGVVRGHSRSTAMSPSAYDLLFDFNRNYVSIVYRFRDIAGYLSKLADFNPPHLHLVPPQGVTPVEFCGDFLASGNQSPWGIVWCCLCDPLFSRFSRTPTCDGQTDGRTDRRMRQMRYNCFQKYVYFFVQVFNQRGTGSDFISGRVYVSQQHFIKDFLMF